MTDLLETFSIWKVIGRHLRRRGIDMFNYSPTAEVGVRRTAAPYIAADEFTSVVECASGLAVVDFTADWCQPCRMMAPIIDALARDVSPETVVVKVDADAQSSLAARFGVMSLPTLLFFRDGRVIDRIVGALSSDRLRAKVQDVARSA